jgi:methionyl-tRNA formyltransferase
MRLAFAGTPAFAATALAALLDAGVEVGLVLSQPDRPAGRGQQLQASPVKALAQRHAIPVLTPPSLRPERGGAAAEEALARLRELSPDVLVVAAYGLLLPEAVLRLPAGLPLEDGTRAGAINLHASLLPRWRGAAPIVRAIEAGDARTGISLMQMDAGLDTGPILAQEAIDIGAEATAGSLTAELAQLGGRMIVAALRPAAARLQARPQPDAGITYARKVEKREAPLDWQSPARLLAARVRAFDPFPGASLRLDGSVIKVWRAQALDDAPGAALPEPAAAGTVLEAGARGIVVACGAPSSADRRLCLTGLQRAGGRRLDAREFLAGTPLRPGRVLPGAQDGS